MVNIFCFNIEKNNDFIHIPTLIRFISPNKQSRINAFRNVRDAQRFLIGDLLIRAIACRYLNIKNSELQFQTNEYGKPYLIGKDDFHYNLSHSGRWVVCAVDQQPVGIDVEEVQPIDLSLARELFLPEELAWLMAVPEPERLGRFYDLWTLKESYTKAVGEGLSIPLSSFTIRIKDEQPGVVDIKRQPMFLKSYAIDDEHRLAVCACHNQWPEGVMVVDFNWIISAFKNY